MGAPDMIATVGREVRAARLATLDPVWWVEHQRRASANRTALMLALKYVCASPDSVQARERARAAIAEYDALAVALRERIGGAA